MSTAKSRFKTKDVENNSERLICVGLIVSDKIISQLAPILDSALFTATYSRTVINWCLEFYKQFEKAPRAHIQDIFEAAKRDTLTDDVADLIESLLASLNDQLMDESSPFNEDYVLEESEKYIKSRRAQMLCEDVSALLSQGNILEAEGLLSGYHIPSRPSGEAVDIFDPAFWQVKEEESPVLFKLPGALSDLIGPIERDSFLSILAPEKTGKTWFLLYFALLAIRQRRNVAFFSVGDMTMKQMRDRIKHMLTGRDPKRSLDKILVPIPDCYHNQVGKCPLDEDTDSIMLGKGKLKKEGTFEDFPDHQPCSKCLSDKENHSFYHGSPWYEEIIVSDVVKPFEAATTSLQKRAGTKRFKLFCYPPTTISVSGICAQLDILQNQENFIPDVIIIDYADLLDVEPRARKMEYRHQINETWMALRKLSQERKCAVLTATQAKLDARKKSQVDQWDVSEEKRKAAHITGMIALNQTPAEKREGVIRLSVLFARDRDFDTDKNVAVLQCLPLGRPVCHCYEHKSKPRASLKKEDEES